MGLISNGTTIFDNGSMASGFGGSLNFISKVTASSSSSIEFTSGIDSTYKEYIFYMVNIHTSGDGDNFQFNLSTDGGSTYAVTKTSTFFRAGHDEADTTTELTYITGRDRAQSTLDQVLHQNLGTGSDESMSGYLRIFNPASTTFVKHFLSEVSANNTNNKLEQNFIAGYANTTSAINAVKFVTSANLIESGDFLLFGVS